MAIIAPLVDRYERLSLVTRGCLLMVIATLLFAAMHASIRHATQHLPGVEVAFFRNLFGLVVIVPLLVRVGPRLFYTKKFSLHLLRSLINAV